MTVKNPIGEEEDNDGIVVISLSLPPRGRFSLFVSMEGAALLSFLWLSSSRTAHKSLEGSQASNEESRRVVAALLNKRARRIKTLVGRLSTFVVAAASSETRRSPSSFSKTVCLHCARRPCIPKFIWGSMTLHDNLRVKV